MTALMAGCGATGPDADLTLNGHFAGRVLAGSPIVALSLRDSAGIVTGYGWNGLLPQTGAVLVTGTNRDGAVDLLLTPIPGGAESHLDGTYDGRVIRGEITSTATGPFGLELMPADTTPSGRGTITTAGAGPGPIEGLASFRYGLPSSPTTSVTVEADAPGEHRLQLIFDGAQRPGIGSFSLAGHGDLAVPSSSGTDSFELTAGTAIIERSTRAGLIGRYTLTARSAGGVELQVTGTFSAGCRNLC